MNVTMENTGTILVVDDMPATISVVRTALEDAGCRVVVATSGGKALHRAALVTPDLILLDIMMPGMDGYETCRRLKAQDATRDIPIIFLSALTETFDKIKAFGLGAVDYLIKPIASEELLVRVQTHLALRTMQKQLETQNAQLQQEIIEHKQAEAALRLSEEKYRTLIENTNDVIFSLDTQGCFTYISPAIERFAHYTVEEVIGQPFTRFVHPDDLPKLMPEFKRTLNGEVGQFEFRVFIKDGALCHVRTSSRQRWENGQLVGLTGVMTDITKRKQAEEALQKAHDDLERRVEERTAELAQVNRMLRILSECNQTVMRATEETELLQEICRIIVDLGGYPLAWIGFAEQDAARSVRPVAQMGVEDGYLNIVNMTWADTERGRGPTGMTIRSGKPCIVRDIHTDSNFTPWREEAIRRGYASFIALPLCGDDRVFGALNIYAAEPDAFHTAEVDLLMELARDLAYGITSLRARAEHKQAEAALAEQHRLLRALIDNMPDAIYVKDAESRFLVANEMVARIMGATPDELIGKWDFDYYPKDLAEQFYADEQAILESGQTLINKEEPNLGHAGNWRWISTTKVPFRDNEGRIKGIVGIGRDITARKEMEQALRRAHDELEARIEQRTVELKRANEQLAALYKVGQTITTPLQLNVVLDVIARSTAELLGTDTGVILLVDESGETLTIQGAFGLSEKVVKGTRDRIGESIAGRVVQAGQPIIANDLPHDPRFYNPSAAKEGLLACASVPLLVGGKIIGTLDVHSKSNRDAFNQEHIRILSMLAGQAAIAIENARLYEQIQLARDELESRVQRRTAELVTANAQLQQEIVERKRVEEALRASEEQYRALYRDNPSMFFTLDAAGKVISVNEFGANQLGYTIAELEGQSVLKVFHEADRLAVTEQLKTCLQSPWHVYRWQFRKIRKDGSLLWVEEFARAVSNPKGVLSVLVVCQDITERKRAEETLYRLNEELEQRVEARTAELKTTNNALQDSLETLQRTQDQLVQSEKMAALGGLVAGIAHEINTPLGVGITAASYLADQTREIEQRYHGHTMKRSYLENYLKSSHEAAGMLLTNLRRAVNLIRSFKQVAVDQTSEEKRRFKLKGYLDDVLLSLHPKLKKTPHIITLSCPENLELESYPGAFSQILTNFVMNSLIHGFVPDIPGKIVLHIHEEQGTLRIRYSDNGKGMSAQECSRIFEPFYTTKRGQGGSGLGLHIVYNLVTQRLNGSITCESTPGEGTTFIIQIPLNVTETHKA